MATVEPEQLPYRPCVGAMVVNAEGLVLIGHRADGPEEPEGPGTWWQMPQGGIDEGEDPREAVFRELYEETSIKSVRIVAESDGWFVYDLPDEMIGKAWGGRYRGQKQKWYALRFEGDESEIDVVNVPDGHKPEFDRWEWIEPGRMLDFVVPFKHQVYRRIVDELVPLIR